MRVLYLSPSAERGGAERALLEGIRALRSLEPSWTLGAITLEDGPLAEEARSLGVETMVLPAPEVFAASGESGRSAAATILRLTRAAGPLTVYARTLRRRVREWAPDIVHSNGIKTHVLGAWSRGDAPLVWHIHDYLSARGVSLAVLRHHLRDSIRVIANSRSVAADARRALGDEVCVDTLYNAIDLERFAPAGAAADLDGLAGMPPAPDGTVRVGLVATFARWKGHEAFLRAIARIRSPAPLRAYIVGGPVYRTGAASQVTQDELLNVCRATGIADRIGFTGFLADPSTAYRALDVVVHASTSPEPFGLSIVEAMACERAVVVSDAGGAREIGEPDVTCVAHPPGDVAALGAAIKRLVEDSGMRARLGQAAGRSVRERFTPRRCAESLRSLYQELARSRCCGVTARAPFES